MGMVVLGLVLLILLLIVQNKTKVDPLYYGKSSQTHICWWSAGALDLFSWCPVFAEFSFTCMVGLTNALEQDGFISGFMGFYIKMVTRPAPYLTETINGSCFRSLALTV